jgi:hypothetical protein
MLKGGLKTAHNKSLKPSYKKLSAEDYKIIKKVERYELADKYLNGYKGFWATSPRKENGQVDWDKIDADTFSMFEHCNKICQSFAKIDDALITQAKTRFNQTQFTFSQSF